MFLFYTRLAEDGKSFQPQRNLNSKTYDLDGNGAITADRNGAVNVFWHAKHKSRPDRLAITVRSTDNGKSFSSES